MKTTLLVAAVLAFPHPAVCADVKVSALDDLTTIAGPSANSPVPTATGLLCSEWKSGLFYDVTAKLPWFGRPNSGGGNIPSGSGIACDGGSLYPTVFQTGHSWYKIGAPSELAALGGCTHMIFNDPNGHVPDGFTPIDCPRCPYGEFGCHSAARLRLEFIELSKEDPNCQHTLNHPYCWYICRNKLTLPSRAGSSSPRAPWPVEFMCTTCN